MGLKYEPSSEPLHIEQAALEKRNGALDVREGELRSLQHTVLSLCLSLSLSLALSLSLSLLSLSRSLSPSASSLTRRRESVSSIASSSACITGVPRS